MKPALGILLLLSVLCLPPCACLAGDGDLDFSCIAKRVDEKTSKSGTTENAITIDTEDWKYVVTLTNNTFKDMGNLEVRYVVFSKLQELGTVAGVRVNKVTGSVKIDAIKGHDKVQFDTATVKLQKASLKPGNLLQQRGKDIGRSQPGGHSGSDLPEREFDRGNVETAGTGHQGKMAGMISQRPAASPATPPPINPQKCT